MKELAEEFTRKSFTHRQIVREGNVAIYERWKDLRGEQRQLHYEVIIIRPIAESVIKGTVVAAHEKYPGSEEWGTHGWTKLIKEEAWAKAMELVRRGVSPKTGPLGAISTKDLTRGAKTPLKAAPHGKETP